jgi:hypothetical protein
MIVKINTKVKAQLIKKDKVLKEVEAKNGRYSNK